MTSPYRPFDVRLVARERLSASFMRITLRGGDLARCSPTLLDQRVKLVLGESRLLDPLRGDDWYSVWQAAAERPAIRTYTLTAVRAAAGEVDVDVVLHGRPGAGAGPASTFAQSAAVGERLLLVAADRSRAGHEEVGVAFRPGGAERVVLVGDETALPAVANILADRRPGVRYEAVLEVPERDDVRALAADRLTWRVRSRGESVLDVAPFAHAAAGDAAPGDGALLWDEAEDVSGGSYLWAAGEAGLVRAVRAAAKRTGVDRGAASFMGYWRRGAVSA
ncbi:siderophore-interacting protein [Cumulibacter manganitolerans]|uniref:siderophore-interacting protein n=1 Tax=Cumulibacter manganitolerans TaxID=1884992 RepID=UPI0012962050|nr:siderophore-interacting protein [Cumulibacter manganitolerans]